MSLLTYYTPSLFGFCIFILQLFTCTGFTIDGEKSFGKTIHFKRKSSSCSNLYCTLQSILALDLLVLVILKDYNFKTTNKIIGW